METMTEKTTTLPPPISANSRWLRIRRRILRFLGDVVFMNLACKVTVTGVERVPKTGPTILLFNHQTYLDSVMAGAPVRFRDCVPVGKQELATQLGSNLITQMWGTIFIHRGEMDMTALRRALLVLESSDMLMIAPEGHRNRDGLRNPKEGFIMLAARTNAVFQPVGVSGTLSLFHNLKRLRRTPITVQYGRPLRLKGKVSRQQYLPAAHEIMYQVAMLIAPELRGNYADLSKATMDFIEYAD
jgi:1-acyl-sn-glycerol-3-phosphate acyltransferase